MATVKMTDEALEQFRCLPKDIRTRMKTEQKNSVAKRVKAKHVTVEGKRMVLLEEAEFDRLMRKADLFEPLMPEPDADGLYPAGEAMRLSLAIDIIRHRRRVGLSQAELARRAGIRPESLNRIEQGHVDPSVRTVKKIDQALREAEGES